MIERMKKVTIVCLGADQEQSLLALRKLGTVHVVPSNPPASPVLDELRRRQAELNQVLFHLQEFKPSKAERLLAAEVTATDGAACQDECAALMEKSRQLSDRMNQLDQEIARLEPWGQFDMNVLERLKELGWHSALVIHPAVRHGDDWLEQYIEEKSEEAEPIYEFHVSAANGQLHTLLISRRDLSEITLPVANFAEGTDLEALRRMRREAEGERTICEEQLRHHALAHLPLLKRQAERIEKDLQFELTRDGMGRAGTQLAYLQGYVPAAQLDELRNLARRNGWAIRYEDIEADDAEVPTKLQLPRHFKFAEVLLDFIGVLPGYNEVDISVAVLVFLSLFCGLLVGDAGYGAIFTALTGYFLWKAVKSHDEKLQQTMKLLLGMSVSTLAWGALTGNWLGFTLGGIPWFQNDANTQLVCFFLAAFHLCLAHLWKMWLSKNWRDRLGNLGWAIFLWANFFTIKGLLIDHSFENFTFPTCLYVVGALLILSCGINWTNPGDVIYAPFTFVNSLSDILSYIRLYAVGLSSIYIAGAFNDMGAMLWKGNPWMIPFGLLVIVAGHLLNIAMAMMSVLVHGIRLNTLEFSGHIGVEWGGRAYRPFQEN